MSKGKIIKIVSIVLGVITAITLISNHPVPIILLGLEAGLYFIGDHIEK